MIINDQRKEMLQKNLKSILNFKGVTQQQIADTIGCSRTLICGLCTGHTKLTNIQYLAILYIMEKELKYSEEKIEAFCTQDVLIKKKVVKVLYV